MREILFRGKRAGCDKWVEGYYVKSNRHWHEHGIHDDWIINSAFQNGGYFNVMGRYAVIKETVGQFTGLTDKNGKKIFEGDIVRFSHPAFEEEIVGAVDWEKNEVGFVLRMGDSYEIIGYSAEFYQVIGNLHDNPELLEVLE